MQINWDNNQSNKISDIIIHSCQVKKIFKYNIFIYHSYLEVLTDEMQAACVGIAAGAYTLIGIFILKD